LSERHPQASFWRQINANFFDLAVLDWCKLFGDPEQKHHWKQLVSDPNEFKVELFAQLGTDAKGFKALIRKICGYRNKFVAHLDYERVMNLPELDAAHVAVAFYHRHLVEREAEPGERAELPSADDFMRGYDQCAERRFSSKRWRGSTGMERRRR
jgi:hypothetical protein